jgi:WD40 repeat protein
MADSDIPEESNGRARSGASHRAASLPTAPHGDRPAGHVLLHSGPSRPHRGVILTAVLLLILTATTSWSDLFSRRVPLRVTVPSSGSNAWTIGTAGISHAGLVAMAFSPDGRYLATSGTDGMIRLWELGSFTQIKEWSCPVMYALVWSARSDLFGCDSSQVIHIDLDSGRSSILRLMPSGCRLRWETLQVVPASGLALCLDEAGRLQACSKAGSDAPLARWAQLFDCEAVSAQGLVACWMEGRTTLQVTDLFDPAVRWEVPVLSEQEKESQWGCHNGDVTRPYLCTVRVGFNGEKQLVVARSDTNQVEVWGPPADARTTVARKLRTTSGVPVAGSYRGSPGRVSVSTRTGNVALYFAGSRFASFHLTGRRGSGKEQVDTLRFGQQVDGVEFSSDESRVAILDRRTKRVNLYHLEPEGSTTKIAAREELDAASRIRDLALSPGGTLLATLSESGAVELWDVPHQRRAHITLDGGKLELTPGCGHQLCFAGEKTLVALTKNRAMAFDLPSGQRIASAPTESGWWLPAACADRSVVAIRGGSNPENRVQFFQLAPPKCSTVFMDVPIDACAVLTSGAKRMIGLLSPIAHRGTEPVLILGESTAQTIFGGNARVVRLGLEDKTNSRIHWGLSEFSTDSHWAAVSWARRACLVDVDGGRIAGDIFSTELEAAVGGKMMNISGVCPVNSGSGFFIAARWFPDENTTIHWYDLQNRSLQRVGRHRIVAHRLVCSMDGAWVAGLQANGEVIVWGPLRGGTEPWRPRTPSRSSPEIGF